MGSILLIGLFSVLSFLLVLAGSMVLLGRAGGWWAVAKAYPSSGAPEGKKFAMQRGSFGWVDYNGCLTIHVSDRGLRIAVWPFLSFAHPPILLPWSAIEVLKVRERWYARDILVRVGNPEIARVRLPLKIVEAAEGLFPCRDDSTE
jgi:hypothetical protein